MLDQPQSTDRHKELMSDFPLLKRDVKWSASSGASGCCFRHRRFGFLVSLLLRAATCATCFGSTGCAYLLDLILGERLYPDQCISRRAHSDELVKFCLNGSAIPILRILNDENHQKAGRSLPTQQRLAARV